MTEPPTPLRTIHIPKADSYGVYSQKKTGDSLPCVICGKPINAAYRNIWLHDIDGGANVFLHPDDEELYNLHGSPEHGGHAADMGFYPIGGSCLENHPELRSFATFDPSPKEAMRESKKNTTRFTLKELEVLLSGIWIWINTPVGGDITEEEGEKYAGSAESARDKLITRIAAMRGD